MGGKRAHEESKDSQAPRDHKRSRPAQVGRAHHLHGCNLRRKHADGDRRVTARIAPEEHSTGDHELSNRKLQKLSASLADVAADADSRRILSETGCPDAYSLVGRLSLALKDHYYPAERGSSVARPSVASHSQPPAAPRTTQTLPELPPLHDEKLLSAVFTHHGALPSKFAQRHDLSYDRLEFLGDAYIETMASRIVFNRFPQLSAGRLAQLRESIVNNWTLANYAKQYGLNDRIRFQEGFSMEGKGSTKVHADVLEAYVAALILQSPEDGFAIAEAWLNELWAPKLQETDLVPELNPQAKSELARMIMGKNIKVEYVDARKPEISTQEKGKTNFFVDVYLTGWGWQYQLLGSGTGWSKGQAGNRAAMAAMANEPLISEVAAAKQAFDTAVRRERELEIVAAAQQ